MAALRNLSSLAKKVERSPIDGADVQKGAMRIPKNTAIGLDHWETRWLRRMDDEAAEGMAHLLNTIETSIAWPIQTLMNIIVLMGKPQGGVRPIALMPMLFRLWTKIRKASIDEWGYLHHGPWDAAI